MCMEGIVNLYSEKEGEIKKFLQHFYSKEIEMAQDLFWENKYGNPIDMIEIVSCFIDNKDKFQINLWISLDNGVFINVTDDNLDAIIKYIYDRFPDV